MGGIALLRITLGAGAVCTLAGCGVDFEFGLLSFRFLTSCEKMLLNCSIAWYCASPGAVKGAFVWCPLSAEVNASAARVASSRGDAKGVAQLCGKKSTVFVTRSAHVLGTYRQWHR